jgi:hypothetical protein
MVCEYLSRYVASSAYEKNMSFTVYYTLDHFFGYLYYVDGYILELLQEWFLCTFVQRFADCLVVYSPSVQCATVDTVSTATSYYKL